MRKEITTLKNSSLRHSEYYEMTSTFDTLYQKSVEGQSFKKLMSIIASSSNILLAYRNVKRNTGSHTQGADKLTIQDLEHFSQGEFIQKVKEKFARYNPRKVRRVEIPKPNGKLRPLGIPSIWDRLIQQCILQVLEPICEAKFNKHSHGFRPNCSAEHAINDCMIRMNISKMRYVVDVDIQGFFDEVHHTKLMRQIWSLGIRDKQLLVILRRLLKAPIIFPDGHVEIPKKGTPQGGILSPLLANITLNEFDWWIYNQWEGYEVKEITPNLDSQGNRRTKHEYERLRKTTHLKEMYLVRYADDFKIFTNNRKNAEKIFKASQMWLKERLRLPISKEKSKITNLSRSSSEFLGFELKLRSKGKRKVCYTHISEKSLQRIKQELKKQIKTIQVQPTIRKIAKETSKYNSKVIGIHNYYRIATHINADFRSLGRETLLMFGNRFDYFGRKGHYVGKDKGIKPYLQSKMMRYFFEQIPIIPVNYVQHRNPMGRNRAINKYTVQGRKLIHKNQESVSEWQLRYLRDYPIYGARGTVELNDNRLSLFVAQKGKCGISGAELNLDEMHCHHKIPWEKSKDDSYSNLILVTSEVHRLIHSKRTERVLYYLEKLHLNEERMARLNKLRALVGNQEVISIEYLREVPFYEQLTLF